MMTESEVALQNKNPKVEELQSTIGSNLEEAKKMSKLVNDLLLISRGEQENSLNNFITTDLHSFTEKIVEKFTRQAKDKNLTLEISEYKKADILLEPSMFERAISNILQNAINYTKEGEIKVEIKEDSKNIILSIADTGVGIASADLPFVFDRFYKAEHSRNDKSGSGLGLSIAKQIIKKHKGDIFIESTVGTGTVVTVKIVKL
jgi:two-component system sensor histidine kinase ResE